jgi:hypothetical protein
MTKYCPTSNIMAQEKDSNCFNSFWHCFLPLDRSVPGPVAGLLHIFTQWQNQIVDWKILACFGSHANEVRHHTASRTTTQARQSIEYTQMPQMYKIYWWYNILTAFFERWLSGIPPLHYHSFLKEDGPADKIYAPPPKKTRDEKWPYRLTASDYENSRPPVGNKAKPLERLLVWAGGVCLRQSWELDRTGLESSDESSCRTLDKHDYSTLHWIYLPRRAGGILCPNRLPSPLNFLYSTSSRSAVIEGSNYGSVLPGKERLKTALASTILFSSLKWHPTRSSFMQEKHLT